MNKIYILFLCLCYAVSAIMANTYKNDKEVTSPTDANIFGHVVDKATGEHLPGITIILKGTTIGSVTDDSGHYMLKNLPEGEFTIEVSFVGFKTVTKKVTTGKGKTQELNFELEEDLISLEGVVVSANRNETKRRLAPTLVKVLSPTVKRPTPRHWHKGWFSNRASGSKTIARTVVTRKSASTVWKENIHRY